VDNLLRIKSDLNGEESQICLFGGCLLITYVPFSPSARVRTPLCEQGKRLEVSRRTVILIGEGTVYAHDILARIQGFLDRLAIIPMTQEGCP
jgi:hypothetical protein